MNDLPPEAIAYYIRNPVTFIERNVYGIQQPNGNYEYLTKADVTANLVNKRLEPQTKNILNAVAKYDYVGVHSGRGCTKCVDENEEILLSDGRYIEAKDLVGKNFGVLSFTPTDKKYFPNRKCLTKSLATAFCNGFEKCYEIKTRLGREITRTYNHPLLTFNGWLEIKDLKIGDKIATLKEIPVDAKIRCLPEKILKLLGLLIGDGNLCDSSVSFSQKDNEILEEFKNIIESYDCRLKKISEYDYRVVSNCKSNKINEICRNFGMSGKSSCARIVPPEIFECSNEQIKIFIGYLFATDGTIYPGDNSHKSLTIALTSVSKKLLLGVQRLMLRIGILGKIQRIKTTWSHKGEKKTSFAFQWIIHDYENIIRFCDNVSVPTKNERLIRCRKKAVERSKNPHKSLTGIKVWPEEARKHILNHPNISQKKLRQKLGIRHRKKEFLVTERMVKRYNESYEDFWVDSLLNAGIRWDEIIEIKEVGKRPTIGIEIQGDYHNYICDLVEHNTTSLAMACLWFIFTRVNAKIIVTGPKYDQLKATIWAEILKWLTRSNLKDMIKWTAEKMYHQYAPGLWFAQILTSKQKENISGIHADHVLWLLDEASNIEDDIFDAIYGGMTDLETKIVLTGNVTKTSGFFYRITQIENKLGYNEDTGWCILHFSSEDSKRKNMKWFKSMQKFPRDSDMYRVYVLGLPPKGSPRAVITIADCEAARQKTIVQPDRRKTHVPLEIGLDPASEGDDLTAIAVRFGMKLLEIRVFAKTKAPEVVLQTLKIVREYRNKLNYIHKVKIKIDDSPYGNAIRHHLALNEGDNIEVIGIHFGGKGDENYADMATKMWFHMADVIKDAGLPDDDDLIEELAAREWVPASGNRMKVEPKYDYKKRLGRSPDRADACILCFWDGTKKIFSRGEDTESNIKAFEIDWYLNHMLDFNYQGLLMAEVWNITALVLNDDISIDGVSCMYEYYSNRLWLYADHHYEVPIAEVVCEDVKTCTKVDTYKDDREAKIYGNNRMFKHEDGSRPFGQILRQSGLMIREPIQYEEYGAIALGVSLFKNDKVVLHRNALRARQQLGEWSIKSGKPDKQGFGCCEAFLLVCSEVRRLMKNPPKKLKRHDYRPVKEPKEKKERSFWMTR